MERAPQRHHPRIERLVAAGDRHARRLAQAHPRRLRLGHTGGHVQPLGVGQRGDRQAHPHLAAGAEFLAVEAGAVHHHALARRQHGQPRLALDQRGKLRLQLGDLRLQPGALGVAGADLGLLLGHCQRGQAVFLHAVDHQLVVIDAPYQFLRHGGLAVGLVGIAARLGHRQFAGPVGLGLVQLELVECPQFFLQRALLRDQPGRDVVRFELGDRLAGFEQRAFRRESRQLVLPDVGNAGRCYRQRAARGDFALDGQRLAGHWRRRCWLRCSLV